MILSDPMGTGSISLPDHAEVTHFSLTDMPVIATTVQSEPSNLTVSPTVMVVGEVVVVGKDR